MEKGFQETLSNFVLLLFSLQNEISFRQNLQDQGLLGRIHARLLRFQLRTDHLQVLLVPARSAVET